MRLPGRDGPAQEVLLVRADDVDAHVALEVEHEPGADGLDDGRRTRLLAVHRVGQVDVLGGVDAVSYKHLRAHETLLDTVCRLLLEKKNEVQLLEQH